MSFIGGYGVPGVANASQLCEVSIISLNYKFIYEKSKDTPLGLLNQVIFLINFTIFRIVLFPWLVYLCFFNLKVAGPYVSSTRYVCMVITCILSTAICILQYWWYHIIMLNLVKVLK